MQPFFRQSFHATLTLGRRIIAVAFALIGLVGTLAAQNYSIDWYSIDGGGGTSSGGNYSVSGTIGQADANAQPMSGGNFSLVGGFWSVFTIQTPDAPVLTVALTSPNAVVVMWPSPSTDFTLQQSENLTTPNWVTAPQAVSDNGTNKFIVVDPLAGGRFYRLLKP